MHKSLAECQRFDVSLYTANCLAHYNVIRGGHIHSTVLRKIFSSNCACVFQFYVVVRSVTSSKHQLSVSQRNVQEQLLGNQSISAQDAASSQFLYSNRS